jgi:IS30 family transposase
MTTIQKQISNLRKSGMSNRDIADSIGYSDSYVSNVLHSNAEAGKGFKRAFREKYEVITIESIRESRKLRIENNELQRRVLELEGKIESIFNVIRK